MLYLSWHTSYPKLTYFSSFGCISAILTFISSKDTRPCNGYSRITVSYSLLYAYQLRVVLAILLNIYLVNGYSFMLTSVTMSIYFKWLPVYVRICNCTLSVLTHQHFGICKHCCWFISYNYCSYSYFV